MYEEFCKIHATITQHGGQKETWNQISSKWGYCRQDLVERFVSHCNICAARLTRVRPLAGIPIIERKFMSRLQVCKIFLFSNIAINHFIIITIIKIIVLNRLI